ncbi:MAG: GAF domain-containing protein [Chloroflexi bacterium]|nr:GAF domain-containing protein [Chloroflexota bacterium]
MSPGALDLLATTDECVLALTGAGRVVDLNAAAEQLLGCRRSDAIGRQCNEVLGCHDGRGCAHQDQASCPLLLAVRTGRLPPSLDLFVSPRGERMIEVSGSAVLVPGEADARALLLVRPLPGGIVDTLYGSTVQTGAGSGAARNPVWRADLAETLDRLLIATGADAAELFLVAPGGTQLLLAAHRGRAPRAFRQITRFEPGQGFPGLVAETGEPVVSLDLAHDDRFLRTSVKQQGFRSYLCVPVQSESGLLGSLHVAFRRRRAAPSALLSFLGRVAPHLATALELARLRAAERVAIQPLDAAADASLNLQRAADQSLETLMEVAGVDRGALLLTDVPGADALQLISEQRLSPRLHRVLTSACEPSSCPALTSLRSVLPADRAWTESPCCQTVQRHLACAMCLPLQIDGRPLGIALLGSGQHDPLPARRLSYLHAALTRAALTIQHARVAVIEERTARAAASGDGRPTAPAIAASAVTPPGAATGAPFLDLRCLGPFTLLRDGLPVPAHRFARRRSLTLLKILLTRYGKPVHREELVELLWPDGSPRVAGDLLNVVVHYLRRGLEPAARANQPSAYIRTNGDYYAFDTTSQHRLDTQDFMELSRLGQEHERRGRQDEALSAYERALAAYTGDFLEDELYSDWCALEREYLRETFLSALWRAAHLRVDRGDFEVGVQWYRRALLSDATLEEVHRALMEAFWRAGRRDEALRQYRECEAVLARELHVAPMTETEALRQRIVGECTPVPVAVR